MSVFGSHTFVPISLMCKKQTSVSHSSTESEIISLDTGLRLDGIPALELWDLIVSVLGNTTQTTERPGRHVVSDEEDTSLSSILYNRRKNISLVLPIKFPLPIGTLLGEEPAGSLLCGFAFAFDRHAKSFASNFNAYSSS